MIAMETPLATKFLVQKPVNIVMIEYYNLLKNTCMQQIHPTYGKLIPIIGKRFNTFI